jgi:NAD(P) transhydrogenase subunit alpha
MRIAIPKEIRPGERRVALVPESCKKLKQAGVEIAIEAGAGESAYFTDQAYHAVGVTVEEDVVELLAEADFVVKVQPPAENAKLGKHEVDLLKPESILLAALMPVRNPDVIRRLAERRITAFSTDCIPRITRAQSMDTLSSQATVAGYLAALLAASHLPKFFPMFMTAAGTIVAAKVLIIGAGVAGLQAIATCRRLGAVVEAFDTRPVVKEEVESLGARFVHMDVTHEQAQDVSGYAKKLSDEFYKKEAELIGRHAAAADAVITTALIGGVTAPKLITEEMVRGMRPGSVIIDLAAEGGGNCVLTQPGETVVKHGVTICAPLNLAASMPLHASTLFSRNLTTFVLDSWKDGKFNLKLDDEILKGALVTHQGQVTHAAARDALAGGKGAAR